MNIDHLDPETIYNRIYTDALAALAVHLLPLGHGNGSPRPISDRLTDETKAMLTETYHYARGVQDGQTGDPAHRYWIGYGSSIAYELRSDYMVDGELDRDALAEALEAGDLLKRLRTMAARRGNKVYYDLRDMARNDA